jgi:hypothetical protein
MLSSDTPYILVDERIKPISEDKNNQYEVKTGFEEIDICDIVTSRRGYLAININSLVPTKCE